MQRRRPIKLRVGRFERLGEAIGADMGRFVVGTLVLWPIMHILGYRLAWYQLLFLMLLLLIMTAVIKWDDD